MTPPISRLPHLQSQVRRALGACLQARGYSRAVAGSYTQAEQGRALQEGCLQSSRASGVYEEAGALPTQWQAC